MNELVKCKICGKEFKKTSIGPHMAGAHNPNCRTKEAFEKASKTLTLQIIEKEVKCSKCGEKFLLSKNVNQWKRHDSKKCFCSRSCANSREIDYSFSKETKSAKCTDCGKEIKIKKCASTKNCKCEECKSSRGKAPCKECGKLIYPKKLGYCKQCYTKSKELSSIRSATTTKAYVRGTKVVKGGRTKWLEYEPKGIKVQGTWELETCKILDRWDEVLKWEYTWDRFSYTFENRNSSYNPDFKVWLKNGSVFYLEVKGREVERDKYKWKSVKSAGYDLKIWHGKEIFDTPVA